MRADAQISGMSRRSAARALETTMAACPAAYRRTTRGELRRGLPASDRSDLPVVHTAFLFGV